VDRVEGDQARLTRPAEDGEIVETRPLNELVVIREFGEAMYPGLSTVGRVERGGDRPFHSVINAENYHALETLLYAYEGQVDCIYIDPPYNTGDRNWQYNNNYVDGSDDYRHSKWLSFMERRLSLALRLLQPNGVLICTVDEHEVHHLGVLLEQVFPQATRQMVTIVNNPKGVTQDRFSRVEEYACFCFLGRAGVSGLGDDLLTPLTEDEIASDGGPPRWKGLLRSGSEAARRDRKDMFYPVLIDVERGAVLGTGQPLPLGDDPDFETPIDGLTPVWPVRKDGSLGRWSVGHETLQNLIDKGWVRLGKQDAKRRSWGISYLSRRHREQIEAGLLTQVAFDETRNAVEVRYIDPEMRRVKTVWHRSSHDAGAGGADLLRTFLGGERRFTFPKSLYAVRDALAATVGDNPDALVLDFFAGSGTTLHATALLNREAGGRRRCILVTNNEVSGDTADDLAKEGLMPGDDDYEARGVYWNVTKPRCEAAITGLLPNGEPVPGRYLDGSAFADGFDENVEFLELIYLDRDTVDLGRAFQSIASLLWLKAGGQGAKISEIDGAWSAPAGAPYAVLFDPKDWRGFVDAFQQRDDLRHAFVVTDSVAVYQQIVQELPDWINATMLYEDYLSTFQINTQSTP
jgi:adenine-specific DNA-methyltransferase